MENHCRQRQHSNSVEGKTGWQITGGRDRIAFSRGEDRRENHWRQRQDSNSVEGMTGWQITADRDRIAIQ
jgi:hypothetical protein